MGLIICPKFVDDCIAQDGHEVLDDDWTELDSASDADHSCEHRSSTLRTGPTLDFHLFISNGSQEQGKEG